eukprot:CAMPEP_0175167102 /NCGR_PEP_ID=MMETSP0087-20121206/28124_1 /TAXON_ID=136419 /ORGANISM="Unknown Unknown, Strain D1" /LENGTH=61 /DNA_ID=CAMNT_0016456891 /DNA_START=93 /DNA_END=275 /DNA_ORIENTATION=+
MYNSESKISRVPSQIPTSSPTAAAPLAQQQQAGSPHAQARPPPLSGQTAELRKQSRFAQAR